MEVFVGSFAAIECNNKSVFFKLFLILWIGIALDITVVECSPALIHSSRATYMEPIEDTHNYPQRFRSMISTLSTLTDDRKQDEDASKPNDSEEEDRDTILRDLSQTMPVLSPESYERIGVSKRRPPPQKPLRRMMTKKALSLFAHWKPSHYTSNEDNSLANDVISAVARGHSRPMGGPLRWGRR